MAERNSQSYTQIKGSESKCRGRTKYDYRIKGKGFR